MIITGIEVSGFRNISKTHLELDGITGLASPNNYGKSNLLEAIRFAFDFLNASPKSRHSMMAYEPGVPLASSNPGEDFSFSVEFEDEALEDYRFVRYGFSFKWVRDDGDGCKIVQETLQCNNRKGGMWSSYLKRGEGYRTSHSTRSYRRLSLDDDQLAIDVLTAIEDIDINPVIRKIKDLRFDLATSIDPGSRFDPIPIEIRVSDGHLAFDDDDLAGQLYRLKSEDEESYDSFEEAVYSLFPDFEMFEVGAYSIKPEDKARFEDALSKSFDNEVPFRVRDEIYRIMVKSSHLNQPLPFSMMSAGTKRVVWLVANTVIASRKLGDQMLAIEEVETSIHPRMIHDLLELLSENLHDARLLVTSHSPYLVQYLKPEHLYVGVPSEDGMACFKRIKANKLKDFRKMAAARGMGFGEYLYSLMSSDGDQAAVLRSYLED